MKFDRKSLVRLMVLSSILGLANFSEISATETNTIVKMTVLGARGGKGQSINALEKTDNHHECAICLEEQSDVVTTCGHMYHKGCIAAWLQGHDTCPYCRRKLRENHEDDPAIPQPSLTQEKKLISKVKEYASNLPEDLQKKFCEEVDCTITKGYQSEIIADIKQKIKDGKEVNWDLVSKVLREGGTTNIQQSAKAMKAAHDYYLALAHREQNPEKEDHYMALAGNFELAQDRLSEMNNQTPSAAYDDSLTKEELEAIYNRAAQDTCNETLTYGMEKINKPSKNDTFGGLTKEQYIQAYYQAVDGLNQEMATYGKCVTDIDKQQLRFKNILSEHFGYEVN